MADSPFITYTLRVRLASPLAITANRGAGNEASTLPYVPAPALRGGLAALMQEQASPEAPDLASVFGEQGIRTSALLPIETEEHKTVHVQPPPLTLRTCKNHSGFLEDGEQEDGHGVEDILFATLAYHENNPRLLDALETCPHCDNMLNTYRKFIGRHPDGSYRAQPDPARRVQVHVGIDRRRHGAAHGILYAREVISEQIDSTVRFQATVRGPKKTLAWMAGKMTPGVLLNLGTAISRGLGRCEVEAFEPGLPTQALEDRITQFNDQASTSLDQSISDTLIACTLQTPALFVDAFLRPNLSPQGSDLLQEADDKEHHHANALNSLERLFQVGRPHIFRGWNGTTGLPHAVDQGLAAGSVLLFRVPTLDDDLLAALDHIEAWGVGLRRHLGFGSITVCDPVHATLHQLSKVAAHD